ncbi:MAG: L-threonylcarbamoyladenylate synthase [Candidatus Omnitrophota bacterium]|nr:L-threonylcarbamoyladenylate synthase [Candidatus Omnitrophota bacterium]
MLKIDPVHPDKKAIAAAAKVIRSGGLVAFPTETVYGLAASLLDEKALDRLYRVKKRPRGKPFTVHISDPACVRDAGYKITKEARRLIKEFWPGPLTIILRSRRGKKIGFRMPDHRVALELIKKSGVPVVAPSANISGRRAPVNAEDVLRSLGGKIDMVLDAGPADIGIESTVIDMTVTPPTILREGAIKKEDILKAVS